MSDERPERGSADQNSGATVGVSTAMGAALGVVVFAITGDAYWIAIGAGLGVGLGAAMWGQRSKSSDE